MSQITYNGVSIQILTVSRYRLEPVYHHKNLLYTHHELHVSGYINPVATAYTQSGTQPPKAAVDGKTLPAVTVPAIKYQLLQPRKQLVFSVEGQQGPQNILTSPPGIVIVGGFGFNVSNQVDANNGPIPLYAEITEIQGSKTFLIDFGIETWVNDSYTAQDAGSASVVLLSNMWAMSDVIDEDLYTTRYVVGEAVFDVRRLALSTKNIPDEWRSSFMFPIPKGFKRMEIKVTQNETGNAVQYEIEDRENPLPITAIGVTRIEAVQSVSQEQEGADAALGAVLETTEALGDRYLNQNYYTFPQLLRRARRRRSRGRRRKP